MRKNLISKIVSVSMFAMMISFAISPAFKVNAAQAATAVAEEATEDVTEDMEKADYDAMFEGLTDEEALQKLLELTDQLLKDGYGEGNYEVKAEGNIVYIDIWYDGLRMVIDEVKQDESQKYKWDAVTASILEASSAFAIPYNKYGMDVSVCVLDDTDHDYVLISTYNDKIYYDDYIGVADETIFE